MNHLDEGTIHAWLDGALSSAESRDIETHVGQCAACSAAAAEARGLVAGASRILNALDDVPANVVPKRAPMAPAPRRQWRAAPWVTGIAAVLILAVGVTTLNRDAVVAPEKNSAAAADSAMFVESAAPAAPAAPAASLAGPAAGDTRPQMSTPSAPTRTAAGVARGPAAAPATDESRIAQRRDLANAERQSAPAPSADARRGEAASDAGKMISLRSGAAAGSATPTTPSRSFPSPAAGVKLEEVIVTGMKSEVSPPGTAASAEVDRLAGCYRIPRAREERGMVGAAANIAGRVAGAVRPRERAAAPTADRPAAQYAAPPAPEIVRLDTVRHPLGFVVRAARSDSTVGSWLRIAGDSARVDLLAAGLFRFGLKDRIACP